VLLTFHVSFSIDTTDNIDAIKQNGNQVEFSFNTMVYKILTDTVSVQLEPTQPLSCLVSNSFEAENEAEIDNTSVSSINATFELSSEDISLFVTTMNEFDNEAPSMLARDSTYSLIHSSLTPSNMFIGEKVLIYVHPDRFNVYNNFWLSLDNCKVCKSTDCTGDSLQIIKNACFDSLQLSSLMSIPLSTSTTTNEYIDSINSEFNFQLAELTVFQFPDSNQLTISCDIGLSPKQTVDEYKLSTLYGQCDLPSRSSSRKRRSQPDEEDLSKITISRTIDIGEKSYDDSYSRNSTYPSKISNKKSNGFQNHPYSVAAIFIAMFLL